MNNVDVMMKVIRPRLWPSGLHAEATEMTSVQSPLMT